MKFLSYPILHRTPFMTALLKLMLLGFILTPVAVSADASQKVVGVEHLSENLRLLLQKEMQAVELGMKDIISANVIGDTHAIAAIAMKIKESFILKQRLTQQQKHELHTKLPQDFIRQDQTFHYMAGMLAHAAEMKKPELINFYYAELFEACSSCHKEHAQHRFPRFSVGEAIKHEH